MAGGKDALLYGGAGCCCLVVSVGVISIIVVLASIKTLGPEDQVLIEYLDGKDVVNGPCTKVLNPFRDKTWRKADKLGPTEYMRVMDTLNGQKRVAEGPVLLFLGGYEESEGVQNKLVLKKDQYVRFIDRLTGTERVLVGPNTVVPGPWEESAKGVTQANFVNRDSAVLVLNRGDGSQRLHTVSGVFFPAAYEEVLEERNLIRVLPHETMIVRSAHGRHVVYAGAGNTGNGTGTSFFLKPYERLVEMQWSSFSQPSDASPLQTISSIPVSRIDMRARKVFYQYEVRTNDNVNLRLEGTIFWKIEDVPKMIAVTDDPAGDVWHHARSALIQAVSKVDLDQFMKSFNALATAAFRMQAHDDFYIDRGIEVHSMEVTKYDCVDEETAATLQEIIQESTDRINRLQSQRSENDVAAAKLLADIEIEKQKTQLILTQSKNELLQAQKEGEAKGAELAESATAFIDGLKDALPDVQQRLELYKLHKTFEHQNDKTKHISAGKATLFLSAEDMNLNMGNEL